MSGHVSAARIFLLAVTVLLVNGGCGESNAPAPNPVVAPPVAGAPTQANPAPPVGQVTSTDPASPAAALTSVEGVTPAAQLKVAEITKDRSVISDKYAGKVLEVTGLLLEFRSEMPQQESMRLGEALSFVSCAPEGEKLPWKKAVPGQTVTVRGVSRTDFERDLLHCVVVKAEGPRCPELTESLIIKQIETDADGAEKALINGYYKSFCIVRGVVASLDASNPESIVVTLTGSDKYKIQVTFENPDPQSIEDGKSLKVGDPVIALGNADFSLNNIFRLQAARLLKDE